MISAGLKIEHLSEEQKQWFALAMCGAIIADGNVAPAEIQYLEKAISFLPSTDKVDALIQAVKNQKLPPIGSLPKATRELEVKMLIELTLIISSDNSISTREMDYIFTIGKKLGFEKEFVQVILKWSNEGILWRKKLLVLIKTGMEIDAEYS